jgi:hypothetical protein
MGERSAVGPKSGPSVSQSDPGLRRPTPPPTAGRKPEARPPIHSHGFGFGLGVAPESREAGLPYQPKTGRGAGQSPAIELQREALDTSKTIGTSKAQALNARTADSLTDDDIQQFIEFFKILDRWDRAQHGN